MAVPFIPALIRRVCDIWLVSLLLRTLPPVATCMPSGCARCGESPEWSRGKRRNNMSARRFVRIVCAVVGALIPILVAANDTANRNSAIASLPNWKLWVGVAAVAVVCGIIGFVIAPWVVINPARWIYNM